MTPAATNFENTAQISVHLLDEAADLQTLVNDQVGRGALDWIDGPQLRSTINREAIYVVGGRAHLPAVPDTSATQTASTEDLRRTLPIHELGLRLGFLAQQLGDGRLRVRIRPSVRSVDFGQSTLRQGHFVPAVTTRQSETTVDVSPRQSFVITGLINDDVVQKTERVPEVAQRRLMKTLIDKHKQQPNTALIVLVTPELVPPPASAG